MKTTIADDMRAVGQIHRLLREIKPRTKRQLLDYVKVFLGVHVFLIRRFVMGIVLRRIIFGMPLTVRMMIRFQMAIVLSGQIVEVARR